MKKLLSIFALTITAIISLTLTTPQLEATTSSYTLQYLNLQRYDNSTGDIIASNSNRISTIKQPLINNSLILNDYTVSMIQFWNENNYLGYVAINPDPSLPSPLSNDMTFIPNNATHFSIYNHSNSTTFGSFTTDIFSVTASYNTAPPATSTQDDVLAMFQFIDRNIVSRDQTDHKVNRSTGQLQSSIGSRYILFSNAGDNPYVSSRPTDLNTHEAYFSWYDKDFNYLGSNDALNTNVKENSMPANTRWIVYSYDTGFLPSNESVAVTMWNSFPSPKIQFLNQNGTVAYSTYVANPSIGVSGYILGEPFTDYFPGPTPVEAQNFLGWVQVSTITPQFTSALPLGLEPNTFAPNLTSANIITSLDSLTNSDGGIYFYPVFEALPTYTVTFQDWDGTVLGTDTVVQGQPASPPVIPTRTGYTFDSWLPPIADIQGNITTVAQYTPNTYLVTWNSNGIEVLVQQKEHGSLILSNPPQLTLQNQTLVGWTIDPTSTLVTSGQTVTGPLSLTAVWEAVPTFTVTWRDVNFSTLKIEYVQQSGLATPPTYVAESGFTLIGWTPDPTQPITENTTFVAQVSATPTPPPSGGNQNPTSITDLFAGVFGAIVGSIMILGTIDLFGIELSSLLWLFIAGTGFMMIWKLVR